MLVLVNYCDTYNLALSPKLFGAAGHQANSPLVLSNTIFTHNIHSSRSQQNVASNGHCRRVYFGPQRILQMGGEQGRLRNSKYSCVVPSIRPLKRLVTIFAIRQAFFGLLKLAFAFALLKFLVGERGAHSIFTTRNPHPFTPLLPKPPRRWIPCRQAGLMATGVRMRTFVDAKCAIYLSHSQTSSEYWTQISCSVAKCSSNRAASLRRARQRSSAKAVRGPPARRPRLAQSHSPLPLLPRHRRGGGQPLFAPD